VTVCAKPRYAIRRGPANRNHQSIYFEKHSLKRYFYEDEEIFDDFKDRRKFGNISYTEILERLDDGSIKSEELSMKTLKRLQVIDFFEDRNVLSKLNLSVPTDDFLETVNIFAKIFYFTSTSISFNWIDEVLAYVSEIITKWGLCFTYNIALSHDIMYTNLTSDDFHYHVTLKSDVPKREQHPNIYDALPKELPQRITSSKVGLWVGFGLFKGEIEQVRNKTFQPYTIILHDPYELPSPSSKTTHLNLEYQTLIVIDPQQNSIHESLVEYDPAE
jgi:hypothetical protein